jgi:hypothetical protein
MNEIVKHESVFWFSTIGYFSVWPPYKRTGFRNDISNIRSSGFSQIMAGYLWWGESALADHWMMISTKPTWQDPCLSWQQKGIQAPFSISPIR